MPYSDEEREAALDRLAACEGDFRRVSEETGVSEKTLRKWARQAQVQGDEMSALKNSLLDFEQRLAAERASKPEEADLGGWLFSDLPLQLARDALRLSESMAEVIEDAPLNQRMSALSQCVEMILKLRKAMPDSGKHEVIFGYENPYNGKTYDAPYWTGRNSEA
jgi:hypothetical protein